jgi:hypothetical protein
LLQPNAGHFRLIGESTSLQIRQFAKGIEQWQRQQRLANGNEQ